MKTDDLLDALGEADPAYMQEAEDVRYLGARRKHFMQIDRKSTRLNSSHWNKSRMPSSA